MASISRISALRARARIGFVAPAAGRRGRWRYNSPRLSKHPLRDAALAGNTTDFGVAYDQYAPVLYGLLLRVLRDSSDAQEILQETFLSAWKDARKFDPERGSELAWLIAMARSR